MHLSTQNLKYKELYALLYAVSRKMFSDTIFTQSHWIFANFFFFSSVSRGRAASEAHKQIEIVLLLVVNKTKQEKVIRLEHPALSRTEQRARTRRLTTDCIMQCIIVIALTFKITKEPPRPLPHVSFCCLGVQQTLRPALWALRAFLAQTLEAYQLVVRCGSRRLMEAFLPLVQHRAYLVQMMQFCLRVIGPDQSVLWQEMPCLLWFSTNGNMCMPKERKTLFQIHTLNILTKYKSSCILLNLTVYSALLLRPSILNLSGNISFFFFFFFTDPCLLVNELTELSGYRERDKVSLFVANTAH